MLGEREVSAAVGAAAYGANGEKLGTVEHFFVDDRTGAPTWVAVATGLFGIRHSIAPAVDATFTDGMLHLPVTADALKNAPHMAGDHLSPPEEDELRRHYGVTGASAPAAPPAPVPAPAPPPPPVRNQAPSPPPPPAPAGTGPAADQDTVRATVPVTVPDTAAAPPPPADGAMTRSEEQLRVDTQRVPTTRARLVKYVVTEDVTITVPIRREEIRVEHVPIDAVDDGPGESLVPADATPVQGAGGRLPDEIVLHTERPVVTVEVVPVERVRLRTEMVGGQETVTEQVQREQIVVDETTRPRPGPR